MSAILVIRCNGQALTLLYLILSGDRVIREIITIFCARSNLLVLAITDGVTWNLNARLTMFYYVVRLSP